jgi:hypothetical protein
MGENLLKFEPSGSSRSDFVPSRHRAASLFTEIANVGNQPLYFVMLFGLRGSCSHDTPSRDSESCDTRTVSRDPRSGTSSKRRTAFFAGRNKRTDASLGNAPKFWYRSWGNCIRWNQFLSKLAGL